MNKEDLLQKELSNLYAISKQINNYFNGSEISFLSEKNQLNLMDYLKLNCEQEEQVSDVLQSFNFNPANTTDSIVQEITENLAIIAGQEIGNEIKEAGYLMSINRLISYQMANVENIQFVGNKEDKINTLKGASDKLNTIKENLFN